MTKPDLGAVDLHEVTGFVEDDPGEVVRGARALTDEDVEKLREQQIAQLVEAHRQEKKA